VEVVSGCAWTSVTVKGDVVAWDYAPDAAWLSFSD
jgi:hypothetical protein